MPDNSHNTPTIYLLITLAKMGIISISWVERHMSKAVLMDIIPQLDLGRFDRYIEKDKG